MRTKSDKCLLGPHCKPAITIHRFERTRLLPLKSELEKTRTHCTNTPNAFIQRAKGYQPASVGSCRPHQELLSQFFQNFLDFLRQDFSNLLV